MFDNFKKLFFENRGIKQTVIKNTFWLGLAEVIVRILGLILVIYVARILGATEYGKFTFALSFVTVTAILSDLGVAGIATREFSRGKENEKKFSGIFTLVIFLCLITLFVTAVVSFFITADETIQRIIFILTIFILCNTLLGIIFSFLRARQKMEYESAIRIFQSIINTAVAFLVIFLFPSIVNLSYGYLLSNLAVLLLVLVLFSIYFHPLKLKMEKDALAILKISWPLSVGFMGGWIYLSVNSIMLGYFNLITENGWYNAASKITIVVILLANLIANSFYPTLSNLFIVSREKLQKAWDYLSESMIFLTIPTVIGGIVLAPKIINFLYGSGYGPSILALQLLMAVVGISFVSYPYTIILVVADQQKNNFFIIAAGAAINIILNLVFIPIFGFYGVILSTIIACAVVLLLTTILCKHFTPISVFDKRLMKVTAVSALAGLIMYFVIGYSLIYNLNIFLICFAGVFVYSSILIALYKIVFPKKILNQNN